MININCNGRQLSLTFNYSQTYNLDIIDPTWHGRLRDQIRKVVVPTRHLSKRDALEQEGLNREARADVKRVFSASNPRYMRVQRKLTVVELHEGRGKDSKLIAKFQRKLNHKDGDLFAPENRKSPEAEAFRREMIRVLFAGATTAGILSKLERKCLWDAINTRFAKRPNPVKPTPPEGGTPAVAKAGRPIDVVDAEVLEVTPDTIKPTLRLVRGRTIDRVHTPTAPPSGNTHPVVSKVVAFPAGNWHPLMAAQVMPGETIH